MHSGCPPVQAVMIAPGSRRLRADELSAILTAVSRPGPSNLRTTTMNPPVNEPARQTIFLAGSGHSGTTWLANLINHRHDHCFLFEPLNHKQVGGIEMFGPRQYLRPGRDYPEHRAVFERIFRGQVDSEWVNRFNRAPDSPRRLVKEIRANLMLGWLRQAFPRLKLVFILRHPLAVTVSRLEQNWRPGVEMVFGEQELYADILSPMRELLAGEMHPWERQLLLWCVENFVALYTLKGRDVHVLHYEHLVTEPERELRRLFAYLGRPFDEGIRAEISRPSHTSSAVSSVHTGQDKLARYKTRLAPDVIDHSLKILHLFSLDQVYGPDPLPLIEDPALLVRGPAGS